MRVLLWHGYLLTGSGSNIYTANVAAEWRKLGHDVLLLCQEHKISELDFVDEYGEFTAGNLGFRTTATGIAAAAGRVRLVRPAIGRILPVYVHDAYEGFEAKTFVDLTDEELQTYTDANIEALVTAIREHDPDAIITGHEVMGPYIALRACERTGSEYVTKLHGSALEYAVKRQDRYRRYAHAGLNGARVVAGGSKYMLGAASAVVPGWLDKAVVVNPGCDVDLFKPVKKHPEDPFVVGFVGKFLVQKGVHNLLVALGLTTNRKIHAVIVGYGELESRLHEIWDALQSSDGERLRALVSGESGKRLSHVAEWLGAGGLNESYARRIREIPLEFTGRLDHGPLSAVLPGFDVLVVPSILAEAFGMVAAEAAACRVLPIVPRHSGIGEVGEVLEGALDRPGLLSFDPKRPIEGIAGRIDAIGILPFEERQEMAKLAMDIAHEQWSWTHVAEVLLKLAAG
jgi:glycosyltransferase involved in cell wall biosynthesis